MQDAVIVSATRTPVGKAPNGKLRTVRPDDMAAAVIAEALRRAPGLDASAGRSYFATAMFSDPDGNSWVLQEVTNRLPGREWQD